MDGLIWPSESTLTPDADIVSADLEGNVMRVHVGRVMAFSHAPHTDEDLTEVHVKLVAAYQSL